MPQRTDPYIDDPYFRDPLIVDGYGRPVGRPNVPRASEGRGWILAILGIGALLFLGLTFGPFGWDFHKTGPDVTESGLSTIGQGR
jgi:hypothetical protein